MRQRVPVGSSFLWESHASAHWLDRDGLQTVSELGDVARGVLEFAAGANEQLEAYVVHRVSTTIQADTNAAVRYVSVAETRGLGVRAIADQRLGYASTSDLEASTIKLTVERARANASSSDTDAAQALPNPEHVPSGLPALISSDLPSTSLRDKVALVVGLAADVVSRDPRVPAIDTAEYHDEIKTVAVASTRGVDVEQQIGFLEIWSDALGESSDVTAAEDDYQVGRSLVDIRIDQLAAAAVQRTVDLLGPEVTCPSELPIVFDPLVVADLLNAIGKGLSGGAMSSGRSPFASQRGASIAPPWVELVDD